MQVFAKSRCQKEEEEREEETTKVVKDLITLENCVGNVSFDSPKIKERLREVSGLDGDSLKL